MNKIKLNLGGEDRDFYFGLHFLGNLLEKEGLSIEEIGYKSTANPFKWVPIFMYYSLIDIYERANEQCPFTKLNVMDWLDEAGGVYGEVSVKYQEAFAKSLTYNVPKQEDKKKAATTRK